MVLLDYYPACTSSARMSLGVKGISSSAEPCESSGPIIPNPCGTSKKFTTPCGMAVDCLVLTDILEKRFDENPIFALGSVDFVEKEINSGWRILLGNLGIRLTYMLASCRSLLLCAVNAVINGSEPMDCDRQSRYSSEGLHLYVAQLERVKQSCRWGRVDYASLASWDYSNPSEPYTFASVPWTIQLF